jgi:glycosyltransferase involved in cell wall biosynthesis
MKDAYQSKSPPMKVLLVHNSYQQPGGEDTVVDLEQQLLEAYDHEITTYRRSNHELKRSPFSVIGQSLNAIWSLDTFREFSAVLADQKPDVVHIHNTFVRISPSIYSACRNANVPVVQTLHNYRLLCPASNFFRHGSVCEECVHEGLWRSVRHACYRGSHFATAAVALTLGIHRILKTWDRSVDIFIAPTQFVRRKFIEAGLPASRILVKPNFVSPDPRSSPASSQPSSPAAKRYALFVGRLSPIERVQTLLDAWARLPAPIPLVIVGGGPERTELQRVANEKGLTSVVFKGHLEHQEAIATMHSADFLIFPSEWYETFGLGIVEAFGCGIPVISSRLGAMEELVDDGRTGLHFNPGDPQDLADKVSWAYSHPDEMLRMGREARLEYETKFTAEHNYNNLMDIYRTAVAHRSSALLHHPLPDQQLRDHSEA